LRTPSPTGADNGQLRSGASNGHRAARRTRLEDAHVQSRAAMSRTPFSRPRPHSQPLTWWFLDGRGFAFRAFPPAIRFTKPQVNEVVTWSLVHHMDHLTTYKTPGR
jgi:hypothetical protein